LGKYEKSRTGVPLKQMVNQSVQFFSRFSPDFSLHFSNRWYILPIFVLLHFVSSSFCPQMDLRFVPLNFPPFCLEFFQSLDLFLFFSKSSQSKFFLFLVMETYVAYNQQIRVNCLWSSRTVDSF
jgi:hypothetical protein